VFEVPVFWIKGPWWRLHFRFPCLSDAQSILEPYFRKGNRTGKCNVFSAHLCFRLRFARNVFVALFPRKKVRHQLRPADHRVCCRPSAHPFFVDLYFRSAVCHRSRSARAVARSVLGPRKAAPGCLPLPPFVPPSRTSIVCQRHLDYGYVLFCHAWEPLMRTLTHIGPTLISFGPLRPQRPLVKTARLTPEREFRVKENAQSQSCRCPLPLCRYVPWR